MWVFDFDQAHSNVSKHLLGQKSLIITDNAFLQKFNLIKIT